MQKIVFTLCSNNYLAQAKTLGDSLKKYNPDYHFVIGLVDKFHPEIDYSFFKDFEILPFYDLGYVEFDSMIEKYNIVEFNTSVKPFYFEYLFKRYGENSAVYYIDPDIEVFAPFNKLQSYFEKGNDFLLTPHIVEMQDKISKFEISILNVGTYNLGFFGVRYSIDSLHFIEWWKMRLIDYCKIKTGLFVDQKWINLLPCFFSNIKIIRDKGCNVGYWNFHERRLTAINGKYHVNESELKFFHFSRFNPMQPDLICSKLDYSFESRSDLTNIYKEYAKKLISNKYEEFSSINRLMDFAPTHPDYDKSNSLRCKSGKLIKRIGQKFVKSVFNV